MGNASQLHGASIETAVSQFRAAIEAAGLTPPDAIHADGKLRRFSSSGKAKDDAGWYVLHGGGIPAGTIGDHRTGVHQNWRADIGRTLSPEEEAAHLARVEAMRLVREAEEARRRAAAAKKAAALWEAAQPAGASNPYLARKQVAAVDQLRQLDASAVASIIGYTPKSSGEELTGEVLVAPIVVDDVITTCELIDGAGRKSAIYGGAKAGGYWSAQSMPESAADLVLFIGEGVATMLTVRQASGHACIAALSSGNLLPVAKAMRARYPLALLVLVADLVKATGEPDHHAEQAARFVGGRRYRCERPGRTAGHGRRARCDRRRAVSHRERPGGSRRRRRACRSTSTEGEGQAPVCRFGHVQLWRRHLRRVEPRRAIHRHRQGRQRAAAALDMLATVR